MLNVKRKVVVFGCAVAFAAAPLVVASPAAADGCPWGTKPTRFDGVCISGAGGGSAPVIPVPPAAGGGANIVNNPNGYDTVNGVPCTPEHYATCYAMSQNG
jgi:hypothetical protein